MAKRKKTSSISQVGVIAFRNQRDGLAVCLITNRHGRWGFPKGNAHVGESGTDAALREAHEEAGVRGEIIGSSLGTYEYQKAKRSHRVAMYLMLVTQADDLWPESSLRSRTWATPTEARRLIARNGVLEIVEQAISRIELRAANA